LCEALDRGSSHLLLPAAAAENSDFDADRQLQRVIDEHREYVRSEHPVMATGVAVDAFNDHMPRVTAVDRSRRLATSATGLQSR